MSQKALKIIFNFVVEGDKIYLMNYTYGVTTLLIRRAITKSSIFDFISFIVDRFRVLQYCPFHVK